jgi:hypothetical protein
MGACVMQAYHEQGRYDPVDHDAERDLDPESSLAKRVMQCFVADLAEDGIHHNQQPDCCLG